MPGMNDTLPCPSDSHRRTALAHGRICFDCEPGAEWRRPCPVCREVTRVVGRVVQPHMVDVGIEYECPGTGSLVEPPQVPATFAPPRGELVVACRVGGAA